MKTILFTNARNESNILEWVAHHLNIGFDYIYINDHMSINPINNIISNNSSIYVNRIDGNILKNDLISKAVNIAKKMKFDWMLYLDCDEFLIFKDKINVKQFLSEYHNINLIGINWLFFGTSFHINKQTGTILENYTRSDSSFNLHIKSFVKPKYVISVLNPHTYKIANQTKAVGINYKILDTVTPWFFNLDQSIHDTQVYIAHYIYQSYEDYINRKINLPRDDTNTFRIQITPEELNTQYNQTENLLPKNIYNNNNKYLMVKYLICNKF